VPTANALRAKLGEALRDRRLELGWSQETLAEALGVSVSAISRRETGARAMSVDAYTTHALALGLSPNDTLNWAVRWCSAN